MTEAIPRIIHTDGARTRKIRRVLLKSYGEELDRTLARMEKDELKGWDKTPTDESLLKYRKMLAWYIKKGMLERLDFEMEIAVIASVVWLQRMNDEDRKAIETEW